MPERIFNYSPQPEGTKHTEDQVDSAVLLTHLAVADYIFGYGHRNKVKDTAYHLKASPLSVVTATHGERNNDRDRGANCVEFRSGRKGNLADGDLMLIADPTTHCLTLHQCNHSNCCPILNQSLPDFSRVQQKAFYERKRAIGGYELGEILSSLDVRRELARTIKGHQNNQQDFHAIEFGFGLMYDPETTSTAVVPFKEMDMYGVGPTKADLQEIEHLMRYENMLFLLNLHLHPMDAPTVPRNYLQAPLAPSADDIIVAESGVKIEKRLQFPITGIFNVLGDYKVRMILFQHTQKTLGMNAISLAEFEAKINALGEVSYDTLHRMMNEQGFIAEIINMDIREGIKNEETKKLDRFQLKVIQ